VTSDFKPRKKCDEATEERFLNERSDLASSAVVLLIAVHEIKLCLTFSEL
jgi:hypothetical protein